MTPPRHPSRFGFTLIELTVVIIIIAIMASVALPRLTGNRDREFELVADRVADLLMMYAQRESLGTKPVGLREDITNHQLVLMILDLDERQVDAQATWRVDRFARPVKLPPDVIIVDIQADGQPVDISQWPLQTVPGKKRPAIAVILEGDDRIITIALASHALAPIKVYGDTYLEFLGGPIDLDAAGRDREDW